MSFLLSTWECTWAFQCTWACTWDLAIFYTQMQNLTLLEEIIKSFNYKLCLVFQGWTFKIQTTIMRGFLYSSSGSPKVKNNKSIHRFESSEHSDVWGVTLALRHKITTGSSFRPDDECMNHAVTSQEGHPALQRDAPLQGQRAVDLLRGQQVVPLRHRPPRAGQHVGPVAQLVPRGVAAQEDLPHGVVPGHGVVVPHGEHQMHPLRARGTRIRASYWFYFTFFLVIFCNKEIVFWILKRMSFFI